MRIAVIGGGISGLTCAYRLRERHDVVLFEAAAELGGHSHTVDVELGGQTYAVDTGFIVYNERTYPEFIRLLRQLKVPSQATQMSFSVSCESTGIEYGSDGLRALFAQRRNFVRGSHYRMLLDILRFNRESRLLLQAPCGLSLKDYLDRGDYSEAFARRYILPMCAAIWSASAHAAGLFPADHFVEFFHNHGLLTVVDQPQWHVVRGGSREYVRRLATVLGSRVRTGSPVRRVRRGPAGITVEANTGGCETFDRVIFACHSDQALRMLVDPTDRERDILGALPYQANDVVLHHDRRLLPRNRRAWASWNYRLTEDSDRPATVTYHMNRLQGIDAPVELCITLNQRERIAPEKVLRSFVYDHPAYTAASNAARRRRREIDGVNGTHFCGAYWYSGFHEDGVHSALDVVRQIEGTS